MEKLLPPSVWQYSYSSVHRMAALVAKSRKGFLEETGRRTAELLASIALLCDSASFNTSLTQCHCSHLWLLPSSTSLSALRVKVPKGTPAVR